MAIDKINSQGTIVYVVSPSIGETVPTATNIQAGDQIGCIQDLGDIAQTRPMTEYKCLTSDETAKSLGSISRGSLDVSLLFNPDDTAGQDALKTAFAANTEVTIGVELNNSLGTNGTIFAFNAGISGVTLGTPVDGAVTYVVTLEIASSVTEIDAAV